MKTLIETLNNPTDDGLYSLKALAASTGDYINNKPVDFLRLTSTKRYLNVHKSHVLNELTHRTEQGRSGDTFVNKRLVYRYAMWVSDEFHDLVIDTFDKLLNATTTEQVLDVKFKLDSENQSDIFTKHQQPRDKNTLQVILGCTPFQAEQFHNELICDGLLEKIGSKTITQRILGTTVINKMVTGKKGDTLLWDAEALKRYFDDKQTDWTN
jgi:hypothetical protein